MTRCTKCKKEIEGEEFDRLIFIPPAILVPQTFCEECFTLEKQREEELYPILLLLLIVIFIPLFFLLLI